MKEIQAEEILQTIKGQVGEAEVFETETLAWPVSFTFGRLESAKLVQTRGRALRVIRDGQSGFASSGDWSNAEGLTRAALESVELGGPASFHFPSTAKPSSVQCFDPEVEQVEVAQMIERGHALIDRLLSADPALQVDASLQKSVQSVHLVNSTGLDMSYRRTSFSVSLEVRRTEEGDILSLYEQSASRRLAEVEGIALAERILERLNWAKTIVSIPSGPMPLLCVPKSIILLLLPLQSGLNGRAVFRHISPLEGKEGQQVLDPRLTLVDDPCRDYASSSAPFDDEGLPTSPKTLIERGQLKGFLYDLKTAGLAGRTATGNGFRPGYTAPPGIDSGNWRLALGDAPISAVLKTLPAVLLVEEVIGLGQGNVEQGEFSNNVGLGFLLRYGENIGRVKNTMIAGNAYQLLQERLLALDDRLEWVYGSLEAPAILVDAVSVTSQG